MGKVDFYPLSTEGYAITRIGATVEMTNKISRDSFTFADFPRANELSTDYPEIAIIGIPHNTPQIENYYGLGNKSRVQKQMVASGATSISAPAAIRKQSMRYIGDLNNYDFDFRGDVFAGRRIKIVDWGDVEMLPGHDKKNRERATEEVKLLLDHDVLPIVLGGDHGTTTPVLRAFEKLGPICVVQVDAHLDWRDEVFGEREGLSSPMRRASEMPWVNSMIQIGLRGSGSARQEEVDAAIKYGSILINALEVHTFGIDEVISKIPEADRYYITLDADGLDPSVAPGVFGPPAPGGITYYQVLKLMRGIADKGKIVGFDFVEVVPTLDVQNITSLVGARIILNLIGVLAHSGQIGYTK